MNIPSPRSIGRASYRWNRGGAGSLVAGSIRSVGRHRYIILAVAIKNTLCHQLQRSYNTNPLSLSHTITTLHPIYIKTNKQ